MEAIAAFFSSSQGQIVSIILLICGTGDILVAKLFFGKQIRSIENQLMHGTKDERDILRIRLNGIKITSKAIMFAGVMFIVIGLFGITR